MRINKIGFILFLGLLWQLSSGQDLPCDTFKTGYFQNIDSVLGSTFIKRTANYQYEMHKSTGAKIKLAITWMDDCTYRLKFVSGNSKWKKMQKGVTEHKDLIVMIVETGEDYYIQTAKFEGMDDFIYRSKIERVSSPAEYK
jgi:hypothetical protein